MSNEQLVRDYRRTDSDLTVFTQHVCDCMTRDITEFAVYGITAANVTTLQTLCDAFEIFPTDEYINQEYLSAVEVRDNLMNALHVTIRSMALRVELKWGKKSPKYKSLGIADLSQLPVNAYITEARMVHAFMTEHLAELTAEGLTQDMLDDMEDLIQALDAAIRETIDKASYRMEKTTERITMGNKLYELVSKYCEIGKRIWDKVNPAFYNDYVIYEKSSGGLTPPTNLRFSFETNMIAWDAVDNATSYQLEANTGSGFSQIYAGATTDFHFIPSEGKTVLRVRARNDGGYGDFSDEKEIWSHSTLPAPEGLVFDSPTKGVYWETVENATSYELQKSYDDSNYSVVYSGPYNVYYFQELEPLVYYKCRARNANGYGPFCNSIRCEYP